MKFEFIDILRFLIGLTITLVVILGAAYFAMWLRTKIIFSAVGKFLVKLGFENANGALNDFVRGKCYVVRQDFVDFYKTTFKIGERLTFSQYVYLPYHGGHTLQFQEKAIYLQEENQAEILRKIWTYIEPIR